MVNSVLAYEHKLQKQRTNDERTHALERQLHQTKVFGENLRSDERVAVKRINREFRATAREEMTVQQIAAAQAAAAREAALRDQDAKLAAALASHKADQSRQRANVARVVEQSEELRELETKLKAAYLNKERHSQLEESAAYAAEEDARNAVISAAMEEERQRGLQAEAYREYLRQQDGLAMKAGLDEQMAIKEQLKRQAYEEFLKEKAMVDQVVNKIMEEEEAESSARAAKEAQTRAYIADFIQTQEKLKAARVAELERENDEIRKYALAVMERETQARLAKEVSQNAKDAALEAITKDMAREAAEREYMETLRNDLLAREAEEKQMAAEREGRERAVRQRLEVALANEYQRQLKTIARDEQKAEEDVFRREMLDKLAEDDRIDQLNAQRRRQKQMDHRREIERLLEQRRDAFEAARQAEVAEQLGGAKMAEIRAAIIEEERKRMLSEAAKHLGIEHLPKGVLRSGAELEVFRAAQAAAGRLA